MGLDQISPVPRSYATSTVDGFGAGVGRRSAAIPGTTIAEAKMRLKHTAHYPHHRAFLIVGPFIVASHTSPASCQASHAWALAALPQKKGAAVMAAPWHNPKSVSYIVR